MSNDNVTQQYHTATEANPLLEQLTGKLDPLLWELVCLQNILLDRLSNEQQENVLHTCQLTYTIIQKMEDIHTIVLNS